MRGIRTMSNSLSNVNKSSVKSTAAQEAQEEADGGIKIITLNKLLDQQPMELKELREVWYTKKELKEKGLGQSPTNQNNVLRVKLQDEYDSEPRNSRRNNKDMYVSRKKS
jgi:cell division FtsZ-interacting protein ZapD